LLHSMLLKKHLFKEKGGVLYGTPPTHLFIHLSLQENAIKNTETQCPLPRMKSKKYFSELMRP